MATKYNIIETERLLLRELNPEGYAQLFNSNSDEQIKAFFGFTTEEQLKEEKNRFEKGLTTFNKSFKFFFIAEKQNNETIGWCGYHTWYITHNRAEIGYMLNSDEHKGKGYMKETLRYVIDHGFDKMNLHRIEAFVEPENEPSLKLMKGFGFTKEGTLREHYFKNSKMEDSVVFSLLRREYEANKIK
ncbi:MAG: GNAT family protein [Bacteroidota bacterium]|nr:GNAT family protein [Bacteroidota bacterium]